MSLGFAALSTNLQESLGFAALSTNLQELIIVAPAQAGAQSNTSREAR